MSSDGFSGRRLRKKGVVRARLEDSRHSRWQLAIELFDLKDVPEQDADFPKCVMGCLGGVPVHHGQASLI